VVLIPASEDESRAVERSPRLQRRARRRHRRPVSLPPGWATTSPFSGVRSVLTTANWSGVALIHGLLPFLSKSGIRGRGAVCNGRGTRLAAALV